MSGILCLKWNNHTSTFIKTLDSLRSKELYCDATIVCNGKYFPVHRFVLTTCSEYFEGVFERTPCKHPFIIIKDIEELHIESLLNYMYNGEVNVLQDRLPGLIRAAEALKIRGLAVWEDQNEGKKNQSKEKKKNIQQSSLLQPKSKKNIEKSLTCENDIGEVTELKPQSNGHKTPNLNVSNSSNHEPENDVDEDTSQLDRSRDTENEEIQEFKTENSELFEAVEEDFPPQSTAAGSGSVGHENDESLFISLLSPNNVNSSEDESMPVNDESDTHPIPQCSTWGNDSAGTNQDDMNDEMETLDVKPLVSFSEGNSDDPSLSLFQNAFSSENIAKALAMYDNSHRCPMCPFVTKTKADLLRHVSYSHSDFRFSCAVCHYKCRTNSLLKKHMLKHTMEKPYSCTLCPYKTARKQHLVRHMKLHTGEKPYSCFFCSYKASRKDRLREHIRKHKQYLDNTVVTENLLSLATGDSTLPADMETSNSTESEMLHPGESEN